MDGESAGIIDLRSGKSSFVVDLTDHIHQLPCCIKYDGPSPVSHYFKPKSTGIEVDGLDVKEAYFRGRKLQGTTIALPDGYSGFVIGKKSSTKGKASRTDAGVAASWQTSAKFQNITLWNHDSLPSKEDAFLRAFHWFDVAKTNYGVDKASHDNCFFVFARDLSITWAENSRYWHWSSVKETSEVSLEVAELLNVCWLEINGKLDIAQVNTGNQV